ncbi:DUF6414 family protein [Natronocalculus amylovorans]|uniref:Uncharacterized protein n=1 Tax=Natronocalculus amylovorans TaxID=2917812 RepID=A0AAE3K9I8_9EURY|nr:hypothetical protein [Natronocalculus amylovorans]MCL9818382.1 hypothetical protein [Natronocalculus amylovorans]
MSESWKDKILFWRSDDDGDLSLREFIYLDEVSVVSLLASLTREITESRTDTETTEKQKKWRFRFFIWIKKVLRLGGSRETLKIDRDTEEVVRRSKIQSKFDELYSKTATSFELESDGERFLVSDLKKGGVAEIEIEFSAHELYHFYKAYQYLFDVFEEHSEDMDPEQEQIIELMGSLFGDQIPVVGKAVNYRVVDGEICSSDVLDDHKDGEALEVVGALDPEMLWQDASTFLYEDNVFMAYVRIPETELQEEWDPVKLTRVIKSISKPVGRRLSGMIQFGLTQAKEELDEANLENESSANGLVQDIHTTYFDHIEDSARIEIEDEMREELIRSAIAEGIRITDETEMEVQTEVLKEITNRVEEQEGVDLDREELSDLRIELVDEQDVVEEIESQSEKGNYLEVSFVAIYW